MMPIIEVLGRSISLYALFGIVGMFAAAIAAHIRGRKQGLIFMDMTLGVLILGLGIIIGGSLMYAITQIPNAWASRAYFTSYPIQFLRYTFGGMVFYGGLFGAIAAMPIYAKVIKRDIPTILKLLVPTLPLAHAIMRIGCFMAGCCHGIPSDTFGVVFANSPVAPNDIAVIPTQLIETAANLAIFAFLWTYSKKPRHHFQLLGLYGICYSLMRFFVEFLRGDPERGRVLFLSTSQFISIFVLITSLILLLYANKKDPV